MGIANKCSRFAVKKTLIKNGGKWLINNVFNRKDLLKNKCQQILY